MVRVSKQAIYESTPFLPFCEDGSANNTSPIKAPLSDQNCSKPSQNEEKKPPETKNNEENHLHERKWSFTEVAYKSITSPMRADPLEINDPVVALNLLSTAVKVQNVPLAKECVEQLDKLLDKDTVLPIYSHLSKCKKPTPNPNDFEPSAPPIVENDNQRREDWVQQLTDDLRHNCLLEIDKNAEYILKKKELMELSYIDILSVVTRDTLQVSSESLVYSASMRWCYEECRRRTLDLQPVNVKAVLRELLYAPRYGLMTKKEFLRRSIDGVKGPDRSGILDDSEIDTILKYIENKKNNRRSIQELPFKGSRPRRIGNEKPKILSEKSKLRAIEGDNRCHKMSKHEKCIINFLTCWTAVFD